MLFQLKVINYSKDLKSKFASIVKRIIEKVREFHAQNTTIHIVAVTALEFAQASQASQVR